MRMKYGISDFKRIRNVGHFYVDKARFIAALVSCLGAASLNAEPRVEAAEWFNETYSGFVETSDVRWDDAAGTGKHRCSSGEVEEASFKQEGR